MADCIPYGSDVSGGVFQCGDCGEGLQISSTQSLPPCPRHDSEHNRDCWQVVYGKGEAEAEQTV